MGLIFFLSSQKVLPSLEVSFYDFLFKKGAHIFVYGFLYFLFYRSFLVLNNNYLDLKFHFLIFIICLLYALSDEFHQLFVFGRQASIRDIGFDFIGMLIAFLKLQKIFRREHYLFKEIINVLFNK